MTTKIERSKARLRETLLNLVLEKDYNKISIQDICTRAKIGRSTFYNHYPDKNNLIEDTVAVYSKIAKDTAYHAFLDEDQMDLHSNLLRDYQMTVQYSQIIQALLSIHLPNADFENDLRDILCQKYRKILKHSTSISPIPENLAVQLYSSNALTVTKYIAYHAETADVIKIADYMYDYYQTLFTGDIENNLDDDLSNETNCI